MAKIKVLSDPNSKPVEFDRFGESDFNSPEFGGIKT